jgi:hypothetical protein
MCSKTFILWLRLPEGMTPDQAVELLGAADYTRALVGLGEPGVLALMFDGDVELSEIAEVARAIPAAVVLSFAPGSEAET